MSLFLWNYQVPSQISGRYLFHSRNNPDYLVKKLEYGFTDSTQNIDHIDLVYTNISPIHLNTATIFNLNLHLSLILSLVCKSDYIQNLSFCTFINSESIHCFIDTTFILKYNIPTNPTLPMALKLFDRLLLLNNNIISKIVFLSITFLSGN